MCHQTDPAQARLIKAWILNRIPDHQQRNTKHQGNDRFTHKQQAQHTGQCNEMQHAKVDETVTKHPPCRGAYQQGRRHDTQQALHKTPDVDTPLCREHQADTDQKQEQAQDQRTKIQPEGILVEIKPGIPEMRQVKTEVVNHHQGDGHAPHDIDNDQAPPTGRVCLR